MNGTDSLYIQEQLQTGMVQHLVVVSSVLSLVLWNIWQIIRHFHRKRGTVSFAVEIGLKKFFFIFLDFVPMIDMACSKD